MVARSDVQEPKTPNSPDLPAVNVPVVEVPSAEVLVPGNEPSTPTEPPGLEAPALQEPDVPDPLPTLTIVWPDLLATLPEPKVSEPVVDAPDVVVPAVGVSVQEIPDIPETDDRVAGPPEDPDPEDPDPGHRGGRHAPDPDAGALARILGLIGGERPA